MSKSIKDLGWQEGDTLGVATVAVKWVQFFILMKLGLGVQTYLRMNGQTDMPVEIAMKVIMLKV